MNDRRKPIDYLKKYVGIKEGSSEHKEILATFNDSKLCKRYTMTTKDAWCATAVSAAFIGSHLADIFPCVECSCAAMVEKAKAADIWIENDSYIPKTGDVILYDWQDSGVGDNQGHPDHVGIVMAVNDNTIKVIEGNYKDSVGYRDVKVNGKFIRGFIAPKYPETTKVETPKTEEKKSDKPSKELKFVGAVTASSLNVRTWAGAENKTCSFGPLKNGTKVNVCDTVKASNGDDWYYICYKGSYGFVNASFVKKV